MTEKNLYGVLASSAIFAGLDETTVMKILASVHYQIKSYEKDDIIANKGEPCEWLQLVIGGTVRGEMTDSEAKVLKIENVDTGQTIAVAFLYGRNARYPVNVIANTACRIFRISKSDMIKVMQHFPIVLENMLVMVSEKAQFLSGRIHFLTLKTIRGKIAAYIIQRLRPNTVYIEFDKNQSELAEFFGVTRPSLSRAFKQLEDEKYIAVKGRTVQILNKEGLRHLSD